MNTCTIETGLLRKHPCGRAGVATCLNCEQSLCVDHAVAQLTDAGQKTGKFMCKECFDAAKEHARSMAAVARLQEQKKLAALEKAAREVAAAPPKKPAVSTPQAPAPTEPAPAEKPKEPETLEFTPKDGKLDYTTKKNGSGYKSD